VVGRDEEENDILDKLNRSSLASVSALSCFFVADENLRLNRSSIFQSRVGKTDSIIIYCPNKKEGCIVRE
jgi:hypothetical protein